MEETENRPGRARDAHRAREAILDAAEAVFAEHGFDGSRSETIAHLSGYNISLLFRYFGDKLGLYTEVLKRIDRALTVFQSRFAPMLEDETLASRSDKLKTFLETMVGSVFDYLLDHPRFLRILTWEMAEGWQTYKQIVSRLPHEEGQQFETVFHQAQKTGLLRLDLAPLIQLTLILQVCQSYLAFLPLYQVFLPGEEVSSLHALAHARASITAMIVAGMLVDPPEDRSSV